MFSLSIKVFAVNILKYMNQNSLFITMEPFASNDKSIKLEKEEEEFAIEGQLMAGEKFISNFYFKEKNPFLSQRRNNFI